jgi:hypothetical protein
MVQDNVSLATIGAVRMQFWRDAVRDIYAVGGRVRVLY